MSEASTSKASRVIARDEFLENSRVKFQVEMLPLLASHYRCKALKELEEKCPWLKSFRSAQPALSDARDLFFKDGSDCINNIEKYTELVGLAAVNDELTINHGLLYTVFLAEFHRLEEEGDPENDYYYSATTGSGYENESERDRIKEHSDSLVLSFIEAGEAMRVENRAQSHHIPDKSKYFEKNAEKAFTTARTLVGNTRPQEKELLTKTSSLRDIYLDYRNVGRPESSALATYDTNIKNFTYYVGCPQAHDNPKRNVAELRYCHATQMPFFQKLQDDLQTQIKVNNDQQEIITALVFRHLIEHLPPNPHKNRTNATDRWLAFWEDAVRTEYVHPTDHPLKGLVNEKVFPRLSAPLVDASTKQPVTRDSTGLPADRDFIRGPFDEVGEKAQMYRWGKELFGLMSKNIHAYETRGKGGYKIGSDHWGKGFRDILERLVPKEYDTDDDGNEVVNWQRERERYVPADGILLTTTAEEPGQPGTPAQPYGGKLNGYR